MPCDWISNHSRTTRLSAVFHLQLNLPLMGCMDLPQIRFFNVVTKFLK